jgi:hypothetical protein
MATRLLSSYDSVFLSFLRLFRGYFCLLSFLCAFASSADVAKGGDGAKSALREIFLCFLTPRSLAIPSARQPLGPIARLSGVQPALSPTDSENCLFAEAKVLALDPGSSK